MLALFLSILPKNLSILPNELFLNLKNYKVIMERY